MCHNKNVHATKTCGDATPQPSFIGMKKPAWCGLGVAHKERQVDKDSEMPPSQYSVIGSSQTAHITATPLTARV